MSAAGAAAGLTPRERVLRAMGSAKGEAPSAEEMKP